MRNKMERYAIFLAFVLYWSGEDLFLPFVGVLMKNENH
jgi:hypothetical protein